MSLVPQYIQIICNKATCRENDGKKSTMIKPFCDTKMKITQKMLFSSDKSDNESKNIQSLIMILVMKKLTVKVMTVRKT